MSRRRALGVGLLVLAASHCKFADVPTGGGEGPVGGSATVALITPHTDDGAVLLSITAPSAPTVVAASADFRIFRRQVSPQEVRVIVVGDLRSGAVLTFQVEDLGTLEQYHATVLSAASRSDALRASLTGYGTNIVGTPASAR